MANGDSTGRGSAEPALDFLARDYDSLLRSMRELLPSKLPEWTEHQSQADFGNVLLQLFAHMGDILSYYQDRVVAESFLHTARTRRNVIEHLRLIGYRFATAAPAATALTLTVPGDCNEVLTISRGDAFATRSERGRPSVRFEYNGSGDLVVDCSAVAPDPASGKKVFPSLIPVEEGRLVADQVIGTSDGSVFQRFRLPHSGLILRSFESPAEARRDIVVTSQLGAEITEWSLQESLAFSRENQQDYIVEIDDADRAELAFGDGALGAVPPAGSVIRVTYRTGGGVHGNVAAGAIRTLVQAPVLASLGAKVANPLPATGGTDRESVEHAIALAPRVFRSRKRAVTAADYRALALRFAGVGKVRAEAVSWNRVRLYVAPTGGGAVSDQLRGALLTYFENKRPVSTLIEVKNADYVRIYVRAEIGVGAFYEKAEIARTAQSVVAGLLAFENVDFARPLYLSKLYEALEAVVGIEFVNISEFRREDEPAGSVAAQGRIGLSANEIPKLPDDPATDSEYLAGLALAVEGGF